MIGIIDYGMGNLHSVKNACDFLGMENVISADPEILLQCDKWILPGVGAMKDCMENIEKAGLKDFIKKEVKNGKPLLGICLGMQALFEESEENGGVECFGFLPGRVVFMKDADVRVPHIGWNSIAVRKEHPLHERLPEKSWMYFDHSYYGDEMDPADLIASCTHGKFQIPALVGRGKILGAQFHPEKSASDGLKILEYFGREL